jgi:hypothetical protein
MATENDMYDAVRTIITNKLNDRFTLFNLRPAFVYSKAKTIILYTIQSECFWQKSEEEVFGQRDRHFS